MAIGGVPVSARAGRSEPGVHPADVRLTDAASRLSGDARRRSRPQDTLIVDVLEAAAWPTDPANDTVTL